eukprot:4363878-Amphidinium_carterae.1
MFVFLGLHEPPTPSNPTARDAPNQPPREDHAMDNQFVLVSCVRLTWPCCRGLERWAALVCSMQLSATRRPTSGVLQPTAIWPPLRGGTTF